MTGTTSSELVLLRENGFNAPPKLVALFVIRQALNAFVSLLLVYSFIQPVAPAGIIELSLGVNLGNALLNTKLIWFF